jgi:hypothetical protein
MKLPLLSAIIVTSSISPSCAGSIRGGPRTLSPFVEVHMKRSHEQNVETEPELEAEITQDGPDLMQTRIIGGSQVRHY